MHVSRLKVGQSYAKQSFIIEHQNEIYLQCYDNIICIYNKETKKIILSTYWTQSKATEEYLISFLTNTNILPVKSQQDILNAMIHKKLEVVESLN